MSKQAIEKSESRRVLIGSSGLIAASRKRVASSSRIVVKVGTNVLMRDDGSVSIAVLYGIAESIANLRRSGREVLLVSSGAVGMGVQRLALNSRPARVDLTQACAAVGQSRLMTLYDDAFEKLGYRVAQVLLTEDDFLSKQRNENLRATLFTLLRLGVVPIINENDTVSTAELDRPSKARARAKVFGDNDKLSAMVLTHIKGDLLILLSDVDGLYTGDPRTTGAVLVPELSAVTDLVRSYARGGNGRGRGGMETKLEAARIVNHAHRPAVIANGRTPGMSGERSAPAKPWAPCFFQRDDREPVNRGPRIGGQECVARYRVGFG